MLDATRKYEKYKKRYFAEKQACENQRDEIKFLQKKRRQPCASKLHRCLQETHEQLITNSRLCENSAKALHIATGEINDLRYVAKHYHRLFKTEHTKVKEMQAQSQSCGEMNDFRAMLKHVTKGQSNSEDALRQQLLRRECGAALQDQNRLATQIRRYREQANQATTELQKARMQLARATAEQQRLRLQLQESTELHRHEISLYQQTLNKKEHALFNHTNVNVK